MMNTNISSVAVLLTCHNRRENSLECLRSFGGNSEFDERIKFDVFLVDDGSTDGTSAAVLKDFQQVQIINGDGSLYWCGGMRLAWETAIQKAEYDYFLWLNDDTLLKPGAISEMITAAETNPGIIVGSCHDPKSGVWTYGGRATPTGHKSLSGTPVVPSGQAQPCQQINGNIVLIPSFVVEKIGILSDCFTHAIGDFDYGFRALNAGIPIHVAPHYQGACSANPLPAWCNPATSFMKRVALLNSPKGIHFSEFMVFCRRHFGFGAITVGVKVLLRILLPSLWVRRNGGKQ